MICDKDFIQKFIWTNGLLNQHVEINLKKICHQKINEKIIKKIEAD